MTKAQRGILAIHVDEEHQQEAALPTELWSALAKANDAANCPLSSLATSDIASPQAPALCCALPSLSTARIRTKGEGSGGCIPYP